MNMFVLSMLTSVVVAYLTARVALIRFQAQHWWSKKLKAYVAIVEALHSVKAYEFLCCSMSEEGQQFTDEKKEECGVGAR